MTNTTVARTTDFLNTLGVQTHLVYLDGGYAQLGTVAAELKQLGITHVRDGISDGPGGAAPLSSFIALARQGITFTIVAPDASVVDTASLNARLALIQRLVEAVPGSVTAIEGANEVNNWPVTFNGVGGLEGAVAMQKALYAAVHGNPAFAGIPVDYFTGYAAGSYGLGPDPFVTPGLADADTQHPYPNHGQAPGLWVDAVGATPNEPGQKGRIVFTETGYSSNGGTAGAVDPSVQARYTLDLLFDAMKGGVAETDLYELMDAYKTGSPQGNEGFGLFNTDGSKKPVAAAIGNLTTILADPAANAATFKTSSYTPTVTGMPASGQTLVLQKSSGVYDVVLWAEPTIWDQATGAEVAAPRQTVTVDLGGLRHTVTIFDPLTGSTPIQTLTDVRTAQIVLSDHPVILEVGAPTPAPTIAITGQALAQDTGTGASDNVTSNGAVSLSGTVTGAPGTTVTVFDGTLALGQASVTGGAWSFAATLSAGAHALRAAATDPAGTTATSGTAPAVTVLTAPPAVTLTSQTVGPDGRTVTVTGTVAGPSGTVVTLANGAVPLGTATLDGHGGWQLVTTLAPGHYALTATATDPAGNTASVDPPLTVPDPAPDTLVLSMSEDAYRGDASFTVTVDGKPLGGVQTVTASHGAGQTQAFTLTGDFGPGAHVVGVTFLNDLWGGSAAADRNLYVDAITLDGVRTTEAAAQGAQGLKTYRVGTPAAPTDTLTLQVSEDAYRGDAQFAVSVDGQRIDGVQTVTALHGAGQTQTVTLHGNFAAGPHAVDIEFLNDLYGGSAAADRNLYVDAIGFDGTTQAVKAAQTAQGLKTYSVVAIPPTHPGLLVLQIGEDAYLGDAQYTVSVDGQQVGGVQTATAARSAGQFQTVALTGQFATGPHTVGINFLNDAYGGAPTKDRNLYVKSITLDGATSTPNTLQTIQGVTNYALSAPTTGAAPLAASGAQSIAAGATLILDHTAGAGADVTFAGAGAVAQLTDPASFHGSLAGFGGSDVLDLRSMGLSGSVGVSYAGSGAAGTLTVSDGTHVAHLAMQGSYTTANFATASDGLGGTAITFRT